MEVQLSAFRRAKTGSGSIRQLLTVALLTAVDSLCGSLNFFTDGKDFNFLHYFTELVRIVELVLFDIMWHIVVAEKNKTHY